MSQTKNPQGIDELLSSEIIDDGWGSFNLAMKAVSLGFLDGFFIPTDYQHQVPAQHPYTRYKCSGGSLYFKPDAWTDYGYSSEEAFANDVKESKAAARTATGGLSLGPARLRCSDEKYVLNCFTPNLSIKLMFYPESIAESEEMRRMLGSFFLNSQVRLSEGDLGAFWSGVPDFVSSLKKWNTLSPEQKKRVLALGSIGVIPIFLSFGYFLHIPALLGPLSGIAFIVSFAILCRQRTDSKG